MEINPKIEESWKKVLASEFEKEYFKKIKQTIIEDLQNWEILYPAMPNIFAAFNSTPFDKLKVVILGQDPYHWEWQAHGLSFSVPNGIKNPPSLKNIYKEIKSDLGITEPDSGNLEKWASEWVFLLNAILTVKAWKPASHSNIWWEQFTDAVIKTISDQKEWVIFLLWWNFARSKKNLIDTTKHYVLEAAHPSPFSAYNWFFGCKHFSQTNEILKKLGKNPINWQL